MVYITTEPATINGHKGLKIGVGHLRSPRKAIGFCVGSRRRKAFEAEMSSGVRETYE